MYYFYKVEETDITEVEYIPDIGEWTVRAKLPENPSPRKPYLKLPICNEKGPTTLCHQKGFNKIKG